MRQTGETLRGIATVSLWAANHQAAVDWYSELLGTKAYFERPGYTDVLSGRPDPFPGPGHRPPPMPR